MGSRKFTIAANWKMNKTWSEVWEFMEALPRNLNSDCELVIGSPYVYLYFMSTFVREHSLPVAIAAQNCSSYDGGAYTGEISASMLQSVGVDQVILGHSERRTLFHEDDEMISKKIHQAQKHGLKVIWCCGELLEERQQGRAQEVIRAQFNASFINSDSVNWNDLAIAYEPVWAIGTGEVATPEMAEQMHSFIRELLPDQFADSVPILYGGSMKPGNARELLKQKNVDGGLIGGASLDPVSFLELINIAGTIH